ncbi:hypothetical protein ACFRDV_14985 [Streptomyces fagopyri]|uniref:hypothetical protein n=1 Tax=Streptomyces fagopyri TaxID=2662397 RepID=UPI00368A23DA
MPDIQPPEPTRLGEAVWLQPYPDTLLEGATHVPLGPEARYEQTESISLAFVTALQVPPPRQIAVLILRDVLGFHAIEVADMLDSSGSDYRDHSRGERTDRCASRGSSRDAVRRPRCRPQGSPEAWLIGHFAEPLTRLR